MTRRPGREAFAVKGWRQANRWLLLRRLVQLGLLALFLLGPLFGIWLVKGNLSASLTLGVLPLTDPYLLLQSALAGHHPVATALVGAGIVAAFYLLVGGRVYCAWVCPVNIITDTAAWLNGRLDLPKGRGFSRSGRYWLMAAILALALASSRVVWEWVNPITILHRGLLFGLGLGWLIIVGVFLFDLLVLRRGWCGHLCPVGAFYSLLNFFPLLRVSAWRRNHCNNCLDCFAVCPEPQVLQPALKGEAGAGPLVLSNNCLNCGRCIDVCPQKVFRFSTRFDNRTEVH
jgi:ferredoxin-type protein NapH